MVVNEGHKLNCRSREKTVKEDRRKRKESSGLAAENVFGREREINRERETNSQLIAHSTLLPGCCCCYVPIHSLSQLGQYNRAHNKAEEKEKGKYKYTQTITLNHTHTQTEGPEQITVRTKKKIGAGGWLWSVAEVQRFD